MPVVVLAWSQMPVGVCGRAVRCPSVRPAAGRHGGRRVSAEDYGLNDQPLAERVPLVPGNPDQ
jgi:hypothetical protein